MHVLTHTLWPIVPLAAVFYSLFLFDIIGDDVGWRRALWAPVAMSCVPVLFYFVVYLRKQCALSSATDNDVITTTDSKRESLLTAKDKFISAGDHSPETSPEDCRLSSYSAPRQSSVFEVEERGSGGGGEVSSPLRKEFKV
eukprot:gene23395-29611_t